MNVTLAFSVGEKNDIFGEPINRQGFKIEDDAARKQQWLNQALMVHDIELYLDSRGVNPPGA